MSPSIWQILIIGALLLLFFGRGKISELMGELGKGITSFKKGLSEEEDQQAREKRSLPPQDQPLNQQPERPIDVSTERAPVETPPKEEPPRG